MTKIMYIFGMCLIYGILQIFVKGSFESFLFIGDIVGFFIFGFVLTCIISLSKRLIGNKEAFKDPISLLYEGMKIMLILGVLGSMATYFDK